MKLPRHPLIMKALVLATPYNCCTAQPCDGQFRDTGVGFAPPLLEIELRGPDGRKAERGVYRRGPNSCKGYRNRLRRHMRAQPRMIVERSRDVACAGRDVLA